MHVQRFIFIVTPSLIVLESFFGSDNVDFILFCDVVDRPMGRGVWEIGDF